MKKVLILGLVLFLSSCANKDLTLNVTECYYPDSPDKKAPLWICGAKVEGVEVGAVGSAKKSAAGHSYMKQIAAKNARVELAQVVKSDIVASVKTAIEVSNAGDEETVKEINNLVSEQITDVSLAGVRVMKEITSPSGYLYVLVGYDENLYKGYVKSLLEESYNKDKNTWDKVLPKEKRNEFESNL